MPEMPVHVYIVLLAYTILEREECVLLLEHEHEGRLELPLCTISSY